MPAQKSLPREIKEVTQKLPAIPGVRSAVEKIESILPKVFPKISEIIPK